MNKMIVANLTHRPLRSAVSIVAIALEVTLILLIVGFSLGQLNSQRRRQEGIGADVVVLPPGSQQIVGVTGSPMPVAIGNIIAKLPHVSVVSPVLIQLSTAGQVQYIYGIDLKTFEALRPFTFLKGGPFHGPNDMLVDDVYATDHHSRVGDSIELLGHMFQISGIVAQGQGSRIFVSLATLQKLTGAVDPPKTSAFYVKADSRSDTQNVVDEIKNIPNMETYKVYSMHEYLSMMTPDNVPMLATFIDVVIGISVSIGLIVIFQAMYTAVMERTREIGILKSLGASKFYIVNAILRETGLLAVAGVLVGVGISFAASAAIHQRYPTLPVEISRQWIIRAVVIAIIGALAGAIYPAFKAAQKDPIDALAYE